MKISSKFRVLIYAPLILYGLFLVGYYILRFNDPYYSLGFKYVIFGAIYVFAGCLAYLPTKGKKAIPISWNDRTVKYVCIFLCALFFLLIPLKYIIPIDFFNSPWEDGLPLSLLAIAFVTAMNMKFESRPGSATIYTVLILSLIVIALVVLAIVVSVMASLP